jgi:DHA1 family tetracycline resistance protein-like MFS transporter
MQFFFAPIIGEIADILGRKKAFYISLIGMLFGFILSAFALSILIVSLFFASRLVTGVFAGNISVCMAAIADLSENEKVRGKNFAMVTALFGISWILAMIVGGYIANPNFLSKFGPEYAFIFTATLTVICIFLIALFFENIAPKNPQSKLCIRSGINNIKETLILKSIRTYFAVYFLWSLGWVMAVQWFPAYSIEVFNVSVDNFTFWYILMGVTWTLGAFFARNYLINRYSTIAIGIFGFSAMTICLFLMQILHIFTIFASLFVIAGFFAVFSMSSSVNLISISANREIQGKIMGLTQSAQSIAFVGISVIAFLVSLDTIAILFYFSAIISATGLLLLIAKALKNKKNPSV